MPFQTIGITLQPPCSTGARLQPSLRRRRIVRGEDIDIEAGAAQLVRHHQPDRVQQRGARGVQKDHLLALVAGLLQQGPRPLGAGAAIQLGAGVVVSGASHM